MFYCGSVLLCNCLLHVIKSVKCFFFFFIWLLNLNFKRASVTQSIKVDCCNDTSDQLFMTYLFFLFVRFSNGNCIMGLIF